MPTISSGNIFGESATGYNTLGNAVLGGVGTEGAIGAGRFGNTSNLALGNIDAQEFLRQHPEFQEGWDNAIATGDDPMRWLPLAIGAASYIDPASIPRAGGVSDTLQALTGAASGMETGANTALRQANLSDLNAFGPGMAAAYRSANPELYGALGAASAMGGNTPFTPIGSRGYDAATYSPNTSVQASQLRPGMLGNSLYGQAMGAGPNGASQALLGRAQQLAQSTGQLSPLELRNIQQGTREGFAARGMEMSNSAIAGEIGNRIAAERGRMTDDLNMSAFLGNAYNQDLNASRGFASGVWGQDLGMQGANQGAGLQAQLANQNAYNTAGQFNAASQNQAGQYGANAYNQAQLANAQLAMQQQGNDRNYALNLAGQYGSTAYNPMSLLGATSGAPGAAGGILGATNGYAPDMSGLLGTTTGVANDVNMTQYNAEMAAKLGSANNKAGIWSGILGAVGTVGGAVVGGPIGAAIGAKLGTALGNKVGGG
jgi:hypothetical protein